MLSFKNLSIFSKKEVFIWPLWATVLEYDDQCDKVGKEKSSLASS